MSGDCKQPFRGGLVVISGPSGSGKTTICKRLLDDARIHMSVSATTRPRRPSEVEGKDYHFYTDEQFDRAIAAGEFIEWARVYGNRYGSLRQPLVAALACRAQIYLMEIDVQGAIALQEQNFTGTYIFIQPPSMAELQRRLEHRNANSADDVSRRMKLAEWEMSCRNRYEFVVVNRDLDEAMDEIRGILGLEADAPQAARPGIIPR